MVLNLASVAYKLWEHRQAVWLPRDPDFHLENEHKDTDIVEFKFKMKTDKACKILNPGGTVGA